MLLSEYLSRPGASQKQLADALDVSAGLVSQWIKGRRPISIEQCLAIEAATNRMVKCEELRPEMNWRYLREKAAA